MLPDLDAFFRGHEKFVAGLDAKRRVELGNIPERAVGAKFRPRVRAGEHLFPQILIARFGAPTLRKAHEKPLVTGEAVDDRRRLACERNLVCLVGNCQTGEVTDVLPQRQLAVDVYTGQRTERIELLDEQFRTVLKLCLIS